VTDLIQAIDWALMRKPHYFTQVSGDFYLLKTDQLDNPDFPQIKVLYKINEADNTVILLDIDD
jgi:hypothetical protein